MDAVLDCREIESKEGLHRALADSLALPSYYGGNLDALFDCLTEWGEARTLVLVCPAMLEERLGDYGVKVLEVLSLAQEENPAFSVELLEEIHGIL